MDKLKLGGAASSMQDKLFGESFYLFEQKDCLNDSLSGGHALPQVTAGFTFPWDKVQ